MYRVEPIFHPVQPYRTRIDAKLYRLIDVTHRVGCRNFIHQHIGLDYYRDGNYDVQSFVMMDIGSKFSLPDGELHRHGSRKISFQTNCSFLFQRLYGRE